MEGGGRGRGDRWGVGRAAAMVGRHYNKLSRTAKKRKALIRNLVSALVEHGRIHTTVRRARAVSRVADNVVAAAKRGTVNSAREAQSILRSPAQMASVYKVLLPRYRGRDGGFTRVLPTASRRKGDTAEMAFVEFVGVAGELRQARPPRPPGSKVAAYLRAREQSKTQAVIARRDLLAGRTRYLDNVPLPALGPKSPGGGRGFSSSSRFGAAASFAASPLG